MSLRRTPPSTTIRNSWPRWRAWRRPAREPLAPDVPSTDGQSSKGRCGAGRDDACCLHPCLVRGGHAVLQCLAQANGVGEHRQANVLNSGAMQPQPRAVEDAPEQVLLQVDLFDGAQLQLLRRAREEPTFINKPLVGDADF